MSPEPPHLRKEFPIKARDFLKGGEGAIQVKSTLKAIGFGADIIRRAAVCAYESEMNVVLYGGDGVLSLTVYNNEIIIEVEDGGQGIEDVKMALREGYSTASEEYREMGFGAGMGLPNIRKNADRFEIRSEKDQGTYLKMRLLVGRKSE